MRNGPALRPTRIVVAVAIVAVSAGLIGSGRVALAAATSVAGDARQDVSAPLRDLVGTQTGAPAARMASPVVNFAGMTLGAQRLSAPPDAARRRTCSR